MFHKTKTFILWENFRCSTKTSEAPFTPNAISYESLMALESSITPDAIFDEPKMALEASLTPNNVPNAMQDMSEIFIWHN